MSAQLVSALSGNFQYLKGAIGSVATALLSVVRAGLSIPQRCDWKTESQGAVARRDLLSIPQRCDWKRAAIKDAGHAVVFQYLKGAIGRPTFPRSRAASSPFNTSKVRLEGCPIEGVSMSKVLSIPQRCDWKFRLTLSCTTFLLIFQYLKGAIGSLIGPHREARDSPLSIPQRCDWKFVEGVPRPSLGNFQYLKGAIGSLVSLRPCSPGAGFQYLKGAIGSRAAAGGTTRAAAFQYLKGAIGRLPQCVKNRP